MMPVALFISITSMGSRTRFLGVLLGMLALNSLYIQTDLKKTPQDSPTENSFFLGEPQQLLEWIPGLG